MRPSLTTEQSWKGEMEPICYFVLELVQMPPSFNGLGKGRPGDEVLPKDMQPLAAELSSARPIFPLWQPLESPGCGQTHQRWQDTLAGTELSCRNHGLIFVHSGPGKEMVLPGPFWLHSLPPPGRPGSAAQVFGKDWPDLRADLFIKALR